MKCYYCKNEIPAYADGVGLKTSDGEEVYVHDICMFMVQVDSNGVII